MSVSMRIESALENALLDASGPACPPRLSAAVRHAVFPGGARIRPQLCLAVAMACGHDDPELSCAAAVAIELLHCASLVHDDLPCFDDADMRRGLPSVHKAWGERLAVLAGDALIVMAFDVVGRAGGAHPRRMAKVLAAVAAGVGMPSGIVAGQAWECEARADLGDYQRAKTGALFTAATVCGALSCGASAEPWRAFGDSLGEAYQVADDIRDVVGDPTLLGKPVGQDAEHGRPSRAAELGLDGAVRYFEALVRRAQDAVPPCEGAGMLRHLVRQESLRLVPQDLVPDIVRVVA